jgi:hypothetical protein
LAAVPDVATMGNAEGDDLGVWEIFVEYFGASLQFRED